MKKLKMFCRGIYRLGYIQPMLWGLLALCTWLGFSCGIYSVMTPDPNMHPVGDQIGRTIFSGIGGAFTVVLLFCVIWLLAACWQRAKYYINEIVWAGRDEDNLK